jgi:NAD(P)-dependent dehydrogenase (short-subunit alcohol dehydrogenase family)
MSAVLITGCSSGIGLETALAFARRGDATYASMRDPARATRLRERAEAEGVPVEVLALDVTDEASVSAAVRAVERRHGAIDVLVNSRASQIRARSRRSRPSGQGRLSTRTSGARCGRPAPPSRRCGTVGRA